MSDKKIHDIPAHKYVASKPPVPAAGYLKIYAKPDGWYSLDENDVEVKLEGSSQSDAEIKTAYESNPNTNAYTDSDKSKLTGIENNATGDQTSAEIKSSYESNPNTNEYSDSEKSKLASLDGSKFLGEYISIGALMLAHPSPPDGSYGNVDAGVGTDVVRYVWDATDNIFVAGGTTPLTDSQIKTQYENNANTNAFTDSDKSAVTTNSAKVGITPTQASNIVTNNSKVGITPTQSSNITTNNSKVGITPTQSSNITTNNSKVGITPTQASNIVTNNSKVGITIAQSGDITTNNAKVGYEFISDTYANIKILKDGNNLTPGFYYMINDFATIYDRPDFLGGGFPGIRTPKTSGSLNSVTASSEMIVLSATSNNTFAKDARSPSNPEDILYFDFDFTATEVKGTSAKGRITYRHDTINNLKADYDFRGVTFKRYKLTGAASTYTEFYDTGFASVTNIPTFGPGCKNIDLSGDSEDTLTTFLYLNFPASTFYTFLLSNNVFVSNNTNIKTSGKFICNHFGDSNRDMSFEVSNIGHQFVDNNYNFVVGQQNIRGTFGSNNHSFTIKNWNGQGNGLQPFTVGDSNSIIDLGYINGNLIMGDGNSNVSIIGDSNCDIGNGNVHVHIGRDCNFSIGDGNRNINVGDDCAICNIGNNNDEITIGPGGGNNNIGDNNLAVATGPTCSINMNNGCRYIEVGAGCISAVFPANCRNIRIEPGVFNANFTGGTIILGTYSKRVIDSTIGNVMSHHNGTVEVVTALTA